MKRLIASLSALLLAACGTGPAPFAGGKAPLTFSVKRVPLVSGYLRPPSGPKAAARHLMSGGQDVLVNAVVSLVDANGNTRSTGLVEPNGHFTLMHSTDDFDPENADNEGQLFTLEAINRQDETSGDWVSLRTRGYRQGGVWHSLGGDGDVIISDATTVVTGVMDNDAAIDFTIAQHMLDASGALTGLLAADAPLDAIYTTVYLQHQSDLLTAAYTQGQDPAGPRILRLPAGQTEIEIRKPEDFLALQDYDIIEGTLSIYDDDTDDYDTVNGRITEIPLPRLKRVQALSIRNCPYLTSLTGLGNLRSSSFSFQIGDMPLTSLAGLENLRSARLVVIENLPALTDLSALGASPTRPRLECTLLRFGNVPAASLPAIATQSLTLEHMPNLIHIEGPIQILPNLTKGGLTTNIFLSFENVDTPLLASLEGLVFSTAGSIRVHGLTSLHGMEGLQHVGELLIDGNAISSLAGLENLRSVGYGSGESGGFSISGNPLLADVSALGHLTTIQGSISIHDNDALCPAAVTALENAWLTSGALTAGQYSIDSYANNGCTP